MYNYKPIPIYDQVEWDITSEALHMLILSPSGGGKTVFLNYLSAMVLKRNYELYVVDGKNTSFGALYKKIGVQVATNTIEIIEMLNKLVRIMEDDYENIYSSHTIGMTDNFSTLKKRGRVLIFDEILAVLDSGDKEQKKEMERCLKQLALKSRASGIALIIASQRLLASDLPKAITEQCQFRVIIGANVSEELFHLTTGMYKKDLASSYKGGVGKGYAVTPKTGLVYIETPYMNIDSRKFYELLGRMKRKGEKND